MQCTCDGNEITNLTFRLIDFDWLIIHTLSHLNILCGVLNKHILCHSDKALTTFVIDKCRSINNLFSLPCSILSCQIG